MPREAQPRLPRGRGPKPGKATAAKGKPKPAEAKLEAGADTGPDSGPAKTAGNKFTPERIAEIHDLVECGTSREEIANTIGVTVGSLQVTCSRLGIRLRRPPMKMTATDTTPYRYGGK